MIETIYGPLGVSHNGNLTNALQLRHMLLKRGVGLSSTTDSEVITQILAAPPEAWDKAAIYTPDAYAPPTNGKHPPDDNADGDRWVARIRAFMQLAEGAYSLAMLTHDAIYAVRDPRGLRPLCLGQLEGGYVVASESCALQTVGAQFVREINPGEIVRLDKRGVTSFVGHAPHVRALCIF